MSGVFRKNLLVTWHTDINVLLVKTSPTTSITEHVSSAKNNGYMKPLELSFLKMFSKGSGVILVHYIFDESQIYDAGCFQWYCKKNLRNKEKKPNMFHNSQAWSLRQQVHYQWLSFSWRLCTLWSRIKYHWISWVSVNCWYVSPVLPLRSCWQCYSLTVCVFACGCRFSHGTERQKFRGVEMFRKRPPPGKQLVSLSKHTHFNGQFVLWISHQIMYAKHKRLLF